MKEETDIGAFTQKKPNTAIHIADNVVINCNAKYRWWNKLLVRLAFGWKVEDLTPTTNE